MKFIQSSKFKVIILLSTFYFLLSTLCGCEAFRRKFVRKQKEEKELNVVVETQEYASQYSLEETYKKYFSFWLAAHKELIDLLESQDTSRKRRLFFAQKIVENLEQMRSLLKPEKQKSLDVFILPQKDLIKELDKHTLSHSQALRIKSLLKKQERQIEKEFAFKCVQEYLIKK